MARNLPLSLISTLIGRSSDEILKALPTSVARASNNPDVPVDIDVVNALIRARKIAYRFTDIEKGKISPQKTTTLKSTGITAIDLFCGAGGWSCGFEMAGINILAAIDYDKAASRTHHYNFPNCETVCSDIAQIQPKTLGKRLTRAVDIIVGSPPCQTFSTLGHGKMVSLGIDLKKDIRNYYYKSYIDYVRHFRPKIFVMENVPGFATKHGGKIFHDFCTSFSGDKGYRIAHSVISTEDFGIPQRRKRLIVVGMRADWDTAKKHDLSTILRPLKQYQKRTSVKDAICDLPDIADDWRIDEMPYSTKTTQSDYQLLLRNSSGTVRNNICRISNAHAKEMFPFLKPGQRYSELPENIRQKLTFLSNFKSEIIHTRCRRLPLDEPAWTIVAHIGMDGYEYIHPCYNRTLSVREAARIQSFPDSFVFSGNMRQQYVQVGNAVPPLLAYNIARQILKVFH